MKLRNWIDFTLLRTFSLLSALILALIALVLANSLQGMLEKIALQQESSLAIGEAQTMLHAGLLSRAANGTLSHKDVWLLTDYSQHYMGYVHDVRVKIWSPNGTILYSDAAAAIGKRFPVDNSLQSVLDGDIPSAASISDLTDAENVTERGKFTHLLEVYVPIAGKGSRIVGAYEVYHDLTLLDAQEASIRRSVWISVGLGFLLLYVSLFLVVRRASRRLVRQDKENKRLLEESRRREVGAVLLLQAGEQLRYGTNNDGILQGVLNTVCETMGYASCTVLERDQIRNMLVSRIHAGQLSAIPTDKQLVEGQGVIAEAAVRRQIVAQSIPSRSAPDPAGSRAAFSEIAFPLLSGHDLLGVLHVISRDDVSFGDRDRTLLSVVADQVAMALRNANLFAERESLYLATLDAMARAIDARDPYTAGHSHRVANYAVAIGERLKLDAAALTSLRRGGVLHDIGKIGVSDAILRKPGPLTAEERAEMNRHPEIGFSLLYDMTFLGGALETVRHHHEFWAGGGYPDGLTGEKIPVLARIMAVADTYDTMTSDRPYRQAMPVGIARDRLIAASGSQFWPPAVEALLALLDEDRFPTWRSGQAVAATLAS